MEPVPQPMSGLEGTVAVSSFATRQVFCNGQASSMRMSGFDFVLLSERGAGRDCPVFLFPFWVMDTPSKFLAGCMGATLLGVAGEAVARAQRGPGAQKGGLAWRLLLYALGLCVGYLLMLLVMSYSVELALSVVAGLVGGRALSWHLAGSEAALQAQGGGKPEEVRSEGLTPCSCAMDA